jgi:hypothetical protein
VKKVHRGGESLSDTSRCEKGGPHVQVTNPKRPEPSSIDLAGLVALLAALVALAIGPSSAALLHGGQPVSARDTLSGWWHLAQRDQWAKPARAFAPRARRALPSAEGFWVAVGGAFVLTAMAGTVAVGRLDKLMATPQLGRHRLSPRGARPRAWARPRDLSALVVYRDPSRLRLGWEETPRRAAPSVPATMSSGSVVTSARARLPRPSLSLPAAR